MVHNPVIDSQTNPDRCPVVYGLTLRRAEIRGQMEHLHSQIEKLRIDCANMDAVLALYGFDRPEQDIKTRKSGAAGLFHPKELPRRVMEHLKANPDGMHCREIAAAVIADKGWDLRDERFVAAMTDKVGRVLSRFRKQERVTSEGGRYGMVWRKAEE